MGNYAKTYAILAKRAVAQGGIDAETFIERAKAAGMPKDVLEARLIADVEEGGPIFGKFIRSLGGAAASSTLAAEDQGEDVARAYAEEMISLSEMEDILDDADPEDMETVAEGLDQEQQYMWVATLVNTCDRCLPLHGTIMTLAEWDASGFSTETIHDGWDSECHCDLVPVDEAPDRGELVAPLVRERVKTESGLLGSKRTQRLVAQKDLEKALNAVVKAKESEAGRRTLRLMGQTRQASADQGSEEE